MTDPSTHTMKAEARRYNCTLEEYALLQVEQKPGVVARIAGVVAAPFKILGSDTAGVMGTLGYWYFGIGVYSAFNNVAPAAMSEYTGGLVSGGNADAFMLYGVVLSLFLLFVGLSSDDQGDGAMNALLKMLTAVSAVVMMLWGGIAAISISIPLVLSLGVGGAGDILGESALVGSVLFPAVYLILLKAATSAR